MKRILLAAAAVLAVTAAQAETIIYVTPGSAVQWVAPQAFKTVINGNEKLLQVHGGATNRDLVVVANAPEEAIIDSADLLVIDGNGKVVETLRVVVSPLRPQPEEDIRTVKIMRPVVLLLTSAPITPASTPVLSNQETKWAMPIALR